MGEERTDQHADRHGEAGRQGFHQEAKQQAAAGGDEKTDDDARQGKGECIFRRFTPSFAIEEQGEREADRGINQHPHSERRGCAFHGAGLEHHRDGHQRICQFIDDQRDVVGAEPGQRDVHIFRAQQQEQGKASAEGDGAHRCVEYRAAAHQEEDHQAEEGQRVEHGEQQLGEQRTHGAPGLGSISPLHLHAKQGRNREAQQKENHERHGQRGKRGTDAAEQHRFPADRERVIQVHAALVLQIVEQGHSEHDGEGPQEGGQGKIQRSVQIVHGPPAPLLHQAVGGGGNLCQGKGKQQRERHGEQGCVEQCHTADLPERGAEHLAEAARLRRECCRCHNRPPPFH